MRVCEFVGGKKRYLKSHEDGTLMKIALKVTIDSLQSDCFTSTQKGGSETTYHAHVYVATPAIRNPPCVSSSPERPERANVSVTKPSPPNSPEWFATLTSTMGVTSVPVDVLDTGCIEPKWYTVKPIPVSKFTPSNRVGIITYKPGVAHAVQGAGGS